MVQVFNIDQLAHVVARQLTDVVAEFFIRYKLIFVLIHLIEGHDDSFNIDFASQQGLFDLGTSKRAVLWLLILENLVQRLARVVV